jgi:hypothetical protein
MMMIKRHCAETESQLHFKVPSRQWRQNRQNVQLNFVERDRERKNDVGNVFVFHFQIEFPQRCCRYFVMRKNETFRIVKQ